MVTSVKTETRVHRKTRTSSNRPRILLVEDEQPIRDIIVPWLFRDGFDLREAADGRAAMELLTSGTRIDLVLSNLLLPLVGGYTLLLHVKSRYPRIPFAFITGVHDEEVRNEAIRKGADGFLLKPFTEDEFLTLVRRAVSMPARHE